MALKELLVKFGVEVDSEKLENFGAKLNHVTHLFKEFGEIFLASLIGEKLHEFIEKQVELGDELDDTAERLGVSTDALQQFRLAGQLAGASVEESTTALRFLNKNLGEAATGNKEALKTFQELHLNLKDLSDEGVPLSEKVGKIAEGFAELKTHGEKTAYAMKLFGRGGSALIPMLSEGKEKVEELFGAFEDLGGGMSKDFAKAANDSEHASVKLKFAMQALKSRIAMELIPGATELTTKITHWVVGFIRLSKMTYFLKTALMALKLGTFVGILLKIKSLVGETSGGFMGLIRTLFKFAPIIALVAVLYLLFDDLYTLWNGGDSIIGRLIDSMFGVGTSTELVENLHKTWEDLVAFWKGGGSEAALAFVKGVLATMYTAVDLLVTSFMELGGAINFAWNVLTGKLTDADKDLKRMGDVAEGAATRIKKAWNWVGGGSKGPEGQVDDGKITAGPSASIPLPDKAGSSMPNGAGGYTLPTVTITNNISGVSDPKEAAKKAGTATKDALSSGKLRSAFAAQAGG